MAPPSYEEDSAAQAVARGYVYAPYPYAYPGQVCSFLHVLDVLCDGPID